jgi:predicted Zn-dependent protease
MKWKLGVIVSSALLVVACTSTQLGQLTEAGMIAAGKDPEQARLAGSAITRVVGAMGNMPIESEVQIGEGIALKSFSTRGLLHPSQELQRYVATVGTLIARFSERPNLPYSFAVVDSPEVNAWAGPGGFIFITSGAIGRMQDESELAGVLAHEIAHVQQRHLVRMIQQAEFMQGVAEGVSAFDRNAARYDQALSFGLQTIFEKGLNADMEAEADAFGTELLAAAGYDPSGLLRLLERLNTAPTPETTGLGWLSSTHPSLSSRIAALRTLIDTELSGIEGARVADRFAERALRPLAGS